MLVAIVPVSAAKGSQLEDLLAETRKHLPNNELLAGEDETRQERKFIASEYIHVRSSPDLA